MTTVFSKRLSWGVRSAPGQHRAGFTRDLCALGFGLFTSGAIAMQRGLEMNQTWPGRHRGDLLFAVGAVMLVACVLTVFRRIGSYVIFGRQDLTHRTWAGTVRIPWRDMDIFEASPRETKVFRSLRMGDGSRTVTLDSLTFPDFDEITRVATLLREQGRPQVRRT